MLKQMKIGGLPLETSILLVWISCREKLCEKSTFLHPSVQQKKRVGKVECCRQSSIQEQSSRRSYVKWYDCWISTLMQRSLDISCDIAGDENNLVDYGELAGRRASRVIRKGWRWRWRWWRWWRWWCWRLSLCIRASLSVLLPIYMPLSIGMSGSMQEHSIHESSLSHFIITFSF